MCSFHCTAARVNISQQWSTSHALPTRLFVPVVCIMINFLSYTQHRFITIDPLHHLHPQHLPWAASPSHRCLYLPPTTAPSIHAVERRVLSDTTTAPSTIAFPFIPLCSSSTTCEAPPLTAVCHIDACLIDACTDIAAEPTMCMHCLPFNQGAMVDFVLEPVVICSAVLCHPFVWACFLVT